MKKPIPKVRRQDPMSINRKIARFWRWFEVTAGRIESLYDRGDLKELASIINLELDQIEPQLAWEVGPGKRTEYSFTISAEGNADLRSTVDELLKAAPKINKWEFYGFKQPRPAPRTVKLPEKGLRVSTEAWRFIPKEDRDVGRIHITVVDEKLASIDKKAALQVVSLFLDAFIGEGTVEKWLGEIRVSARPKGKIRTHHISRLFDYIIWATQRERSPLIKHRFE